MDVISTLMADDDFQNIAMKNSSLKLFIDHHYEQVEKGYISDVCVSKKNLNTKRFLSYSEHESHAILSDDDLYNFVES